MSRAHPKSPTSGGLLAKLDSGMAQAIGDLGGLWMPQELICPPLAPQDLNRVDALIAALRHAGASGSGASPVFAYGLHLNIEETDLSAPRLTAVLRAYAVLQDWLGERSCRDLTRRLLRFAAPFPAAYLRVLLAPGYAPDLKRLASDYLHHNPTRNRGLDLLPILGLLTPRQVAASVEHPCLAARPAYHYRLPDSRVDEAGWQGAAGEWAHWQIVERLAADPQRLDRLAARCLEHLEQPGLLRASWRAQVDAHLRSEDGVPPSEIAA